MGILSLIFVYHIDLQAQEGQRCDLRPELTQEIIPLCMQICGAATAAIMVLHPIPNLSDSVFD